LSAPSLDLLLDLGAHLQISVPDPYVASYPLSDLPDYLSGLYVLIWDLHVLSSSLLLRILFIRSPVNV